MKPTVGRTVHYGATEPDGIKPRCAFITEVRLAKPEAAPPDLASAWYSDETNWLVSLRVLSPYGASYDLAPRDISYANKLTAGFWSWPPRE